MRVVVLGSLMQDLVVRVSRLPLVGESLLGHDFAMFPGGKGGNAAIASARLGAGVHLVGRVGDDAFGEHLIETLRADGVDCSFVQRDPAIGTGVAIPMVFDDGRNSIISVPRANLAMTSADAIAAHEAIENADVLIVQFEVAMEATLAAMQIAHDAGVPVLLNAAPVTPYPPEALRMATYLVVNDIEATAMVPDAHGDHAREAAELLSKGPAAVAVTLGEQGAVLATQDGTAFVSPFTVDAVDSVGAGDAFCAAFAFAMARGAVGERDPLAAVRFANAAGAVAVTRPGAAPSLPRLAEVEALLRGELRG